MDWDDLRYLLAVSRTGSLTGAADEIGVVRTTVGRRIDALEERLGVRLFDRTPDGFVPTGSGQELVDVAGAFESEILAAEGRVLGRDAELRGRLRVTTVDFVYEALADVFASFLARYPAVELTLCATYDQMSLRRREADIALRITNDPPESLVGRRLGRIEGRLYASRDLAARVGPDPDLDALPWIRDDERSDDGSMDPWFARHAPNARIVMRVGGSYSAVRAAVSAGVGVQFLPCIDADSDPGLVPIGGRFEHFYRDLWALTLPDLRTNNRVRAFMDHLYDATRDRAELHPDATVNVK